MQLILKKGIRNIFHYIQTIIQLFRIQYILCKNSDKMLWENDMRIRFIISPFPFPNFKYLICRFLLTCVRINIYKVISRDDYILLWFTFYVNWHLSNNRYHILPYHVDTYGGFVEFPQNGVYFNWSVFWSIMVNPRFFIKHLCWCYYHPILQPIFLYPMGTC